MSMIRFCGARQSAIISNASGAAAGTNKKRILNPLEILLYWRSRKETPFRGSEVLLIVEFYYMPQL